jgi:hypothetical protein
VVGQRIEVELDEGTLTYLRQLSVPRGDLAAVAAAVLRELALQHAVTSLEIWHHKNHRFAAIADEERERALTEAGLDV